MFDKTKSCKDCPDRTVGPPRCHTYCEGYLERMEKHRIAKEKEAKAKKLRNDLIEVSHYHVRKR